MRPLWQLLIDFYNPAATRRLSCEECFIVLDFLAEQLASDSHPEALQPLIKQKLAGCPNCQSKFVDWIKQMESTHSES